jgi:hypothetical protein
MGWRGGEGGGGGGGGVGDREIYILRIFIVQLQSVTINDTVTFGRDILGNVHSTRLKKLEIFGELNLPPSSGRPKKRENDFFGSIRKSLCQFVDHR